MQGTRSNRRRIIFSLILPIAIIALLILLDQLSKIFFKNLYLENGRTNIIDGFFYFSFLENTGAMWGFLSDKAWAQTFFKIFTGIALVAFAFFFYFAYKKNYRWLKYSIVLIIAGTIGNYIDRLFFNAVRDFIGFTFGTYNYPLFNLADCFLVVGVIMVVVHYLFLDKNAVFGKKNGKKTDSK